MSTVGVLPLQTTVAAFTSVFISAVALTVIIHRMDGSSIASIRRIFGMLFISTLIWLLMYSASISYSRISNNSSTGINGFVLGGFLAVSLELLVVNGAFLKNTGWSFVLSLMHPAAVFLLVFSSTINLAVHGVAIIAGLLTVLLVLVFLFKLKRFETRSHKISSLSLLQAFLKTWTSKNPNELEEYFISYSHSEKTITELAKFTTPKNEIVLVLPDIHPGPFYPVGSYNLSEMIYRQLKTSGSIPLVLHGTGGHERNLPSNHYTEQYADRIRKFVESLPATSNTQDIRGPLRIILGQTTINCIAFNRDVFMTISNAPFNSDDLDPRIFREILMAAEETGFRMSVIDAHNCIGGDNGPSLNAAREEWSHMLRKLEALKPHALKIGYAHSSEIRSTLGPDISEGGIGILIFENEGSKDVLIVADSNNALAGLRETIAEALKIKGFQLMELCTSDTHNLAARSLVKRGYFALGEATPGNQVVNVISKLVNLADSRIVPSSYVVTSLSMEFPLIGKESLEDFALVTNKSFAFSKTFTKAAVPLISTFIIATILY